MFEKQEKNVTVKDSKRIAMNKKENRKKVRNTIRFFQLFTVFVFVSVVILGGILFLFSKKEKYSETEKRALTSFPSFSVKTLADGSYTDNITKYVSDNFVFRESFVSLSKTLEKNRGINYDGITSYAKNEDETVLQIKSIDMPLKKVKKTIFGTESAKLGETVKSNIDFSDVLDNEDIYSELDEEEIVGQQVGSLFVFGDTALEIFYGSSKIASDYVNILNTYRLAVPQNVNVYNLVIPTHFEFGLPKKYKSEVGKPQKPFIDEIYSSLSPNITSVDAYSNIEKHYKNSEYLYFRSDHHWTALGAYRAYEAFASKAGFEPTPLSLFETRKVDRFLGTFYSSTFNKDLEQNPDYVEYYAPTNLCNVTNYNEDGSIATTNGYVVANKVSGDSNNGYLVFMGGDKPLSVIETDADNDRSILIFKESYGNAFVPFLTRNFSKIYVADIRTFPFNGVDFVSQNNISDVLFINNTITASTPARIRNYIDIMEK